ncbi:MAG: D-alanyl-D-alanine carboxypeptidase [Oscillospiraceae bacterium]|jgi:D-alanyl-D-alanine carboxypeptidase/D-alanyl-D-alanine carboxypeptidase (penicillin-binding protein 5/6)|nr:D-alanyl-D-alanine carboxypeptidase [Oscillospiraceae bacterium]
MFRRSYKRIFTPLTAMLLIWAAMTPAWCAAPKAAPVEPSVSAKHAVLIDAADARVLFARQAESPAPMASTTKIMSALLLLEAGAPETEVVATAAMVTMEGTSMGLRAGDTVSRYALACGMLLSSGNDAANTTALHLAGSTAAFAQRMNARAAQIGMEKTRFVTASGLDADGHRSTALDMALLGREALQNAAFREICGQAQIRVAYGNPPYPRTLRNHNRLVRELEGCIGLKTGFTKMAGRCLVSACTRNGVTLLAVTLNAPNDWEDHRRLYDYGFARYQSYTLDNPNASFSLPLTGGTQATARLIFARPPEVKLPETPKALRRVVLMRPFEYAPLTKGRVAGTVRYYDGGALLAEVPLVVAADYTPKAHAPKKNGLWAKLKAFFHRKK